MTESMANISPRIEEEEQNEVYLSRKQRPVPLSVKATLSKNPLGPGPSSVDQLRVNLKSVKRKDSIPMFKRLEDQYNQKETLTQLEAHKKALQQVRDLKRVINSDEIQEHALIYKKSKDERLEEISIKRKEEVQLMKERHLQLKKYQIPKKVISSNGSVAYGEEK